METETGSNFSETNNPTVFDESLYANYEIISDSIKRIQASSKLPLSSITDIITPKIKPSNTNMEKSLWHERNVTLCLHNLPKPANGNIYSPKEVVDILSPCEIPKFTQKSSTIRRSKRWFLLNEETFINKRSGSTISLTEIEENIRDCKNKRIY